MPKVKSGPKRYQREMVSTYKELLTNNPIPESFLKASRTTTGKGTPGRISRELNFDEERDHGDGGGDLWFGCVVWNAEALSEFQLHQEWRNKLYSDLGLGRILCGCLEKAKGRKWPGIHKMDWKKPFVIVDIITDETGTVGGSHYLRVQETPTAGNTDTGGKLWDLVFPAECADVVEEMVRRLRFGSKTTVLLWDTFKQPYLRPWQDGDYLVAGELHLQPRRKGAKPSVLIFHREEISKDRITAIKECKGLSEMRETLQKDEYAKYILMANKGREVIFYVVGYAPPFEMAEEMSPDKKSMEAVDEELDKTTLTDQPKANGEVEEEMATESEEKEEESFAMGRIKRLKRVNTTPNQGKETVEVENKQNGKKPEVEATTTTPLRRSQRGKSKSPQKKGTDTPSSSQKKKKEECSEEFQFSQYLEEL